MAVVKSTLDESLDFHEVRKEFIRKWSVGHRFINSSDIKTDLMKKGFSKFCVNCGEELSGRRRSWCSAECVNTYMDNYDWNTIRRRIIKRDKICQTCGVDDELEVHHIHPIVSGGEPFDDDNLVLLCTGCHMDAHRELSEEEIQYREREEIKKYIKDNNIKTLDKFGVV